MQTQKHFANINGTDIYYEIAGSGHPLTLVHAGICDSRMWDEQFTHFAEHYQVIRYDMRGYGQSKPAEVPYAHHQDLSALLQHVGITKTHLVGCSFGGTNCLDFTLAHPEMVNGLVIVGSTPSGYRLTTALIGDLKAVDTLIETGDIDGAAALEVEIWVDGPQRTAGQVASAIRQRVHAMNKIALRNEVLDLGKFQPLEPPAIERLQTIQSPTLLMAGALDQPRTLKAIDWMASEIPGAQKMLIAESAHLPSMEHPEIFNAAVLNFLNHIHAPMTS